MIMHETFFCVFSLTVAKKILLIMQTRHLHSINTPTERNVHII